MTQRYIGSGYIIDQKLIGHGSIKPPNKNFRRLYIFNPKVIQHKNLNDSNILKKSNTITLNGDLFISLNQIESISYFLNFYLNYSFMVL